MTEAELDQLEELSAQPIHIGSPGYTQSGTPFTAMVPAQAVILMRVFSCVPALIAEIRRLRAALEAQDAERMEELKCFQERNDG